jgi:hypothetical protein
MEDRLESILQLHRFEYLCQLLLVSFESGAVRFDQIAHYFVIVELPPELLSVKIYIEPQAPTC